MAESRGKRLKMALKQSGKTQGDLAEHMETSQPAVSQWCTDKNVPTENNLDVISEFLGVSREWLKYGSGRKKRPDATAARSNYGTDERWQFRVAPADGGRDFGNANVWAFDPNIDTFVREVLQNASDAALPGKGGTVRVAFKLIRLRGKDLEQYRKAMDWYRLRNHLEASASTGQKLGKILQSNLEYMDAKDELTLLVVEDAGTTGLIGPETGNGKFAALCRDNLYSNKDGSESKGGAFGLGKGVLWRASRFATVLFCSDLSSLESESGEKDLRLIGRSDLTWHNLDTDETDYAGPGWFGNVSEDTAESVWANETLASDLFLSRNRDKLGTGTSACVVGFHDPSSDQERSPRELAAEIEEATARHFFPAILWDRLAVTVETYESREQYENEAPGTSVDVNVHQHCPEFAEMITAAALGEFADEPGEPGEIVSRGIPLTVSPQKRRGGHGELTHDGLLVVRFAEEESSSSSVNTLAVMRGPGMVVEEIGLRGVCLGAREFHAILLGGLAVDSTDAAKLADEFLRTAEPPAHNKWTKTPDLKASYKHGCISNLNQFIASAKEEIRDLVKPATRDLGDGPNAMRELFKIGNEGSGAKSAERPRVIPESSHVDDEGRWVIECRCRFNVDKKARVTKPVLVFLAESGGGQAVSWETIEPIENCELRDDWLVIPPRKREIRFRATSSVSTHPVPAMQSCVSVELRKTKFESVKS